jgi:mannitol/fructose-specific phosphotransferase system IIA component (Ntr-type)
MRIARKYISSDKIADFEEEIAGCFTALKVPEAPRTDFGEGIMQYLLPSHIQIIPDKTDWKEALVQSCRPLLLGDSITKEYVDAILEEQTQQHHYMFLTDGLVLAHSKSEHGVKKVDAAITVFKEPVTWENGKMVHIIVSIAAADQTRHIRILNDILDIFSNKKSLEQIPALGSPSEVREYLQRRLDAAAK